MWALFYTNLYKSSPRVAKFQYNNCKNKKIRVYVVVSSKYVTGQINIPYSIASLRYFYCFGFFHSFHHFSSVYSPCKILNGTVMFKLCRDWNSFDHRSFAIA